MLTRSVVEWSREDVLLWLEESGHKDYISHFDFHEIDGKALLTLKEEDNIVGDKHTVYKLGPYKKLFISIKRLQRDNVGLLFELGQIDLFPSSSFYTQQKPEVHLFRSTSSKGYKTSHACGLRPVAQLIGAEGYS